jgi:hypothetical protein
MRKLLILLVLTAAAPAYANTCIDTRQIDSSKSRDGHTMVFKMKDGTTLVNHLRGTCPDLKFNGFAWHTHSGDNKVCENEDSFQVLQSMQVCMLGKFDAAARSVPDLDEHAAR